MSESFAIVNADVVLPEQIYARGAVVVRNGRIVEVATSRHLLETRPERQIDAGGAYLMPGIVDLHNDALEFEINPRPRANLPLPFAFANLERRLLAAGVTTEFHALSYINREAAQRTVEGAAGRADYIASVRARGTTTIDHQILHRIDVWTPEHLDLVFESVARMDVKYVSLNDHTPGQGQYPDLAQHVERMREYASTRGTPTPDVETLYERFQSRLTDNETIPSIYQRIAREAAQHGIAISTHDDDSAAKVDAQWVIGASIAEFPITIAAAEQARARGMSIIVGAPNVVRGGSQSGNLDARELFARGLADIICADYHAPSLLSAAFRLARERYLSMPAAIATITLNPARAVGMHNRGAIAPGLRADLILVRPDRDEVPHVEAVFVGGHAAMRYERPAMVAAL